MFSKTDGTLDKFIGDAIMAVWGNVQSHGPVADAKACARTALGMRKALKELNEGWRGEGRMTLGMGVGINFAAKRSRAISARAIEPT